MHEVDEPEPGEGCVLRRLVQNRVAGEQRGDDRVQPDEVGVVPCADVRDQPDRLVGNPLLDDTGGRCGHGPGRDDRVDVVEVPVDALAHRGDLVARLHDRLADLPRGDAGALFGFGREKVAERAHECRPCLEAARRPRGLGAPGALDLLGDLALVGHGDAADDVTRRRVAHVERSFDRRRSFDCFLGNGGTRLADRRCRDGRRRGRRARDRRLARFDDEVDPPGLLLAGAAFELADVALVREPLQGLLEVVERTERVPPFGPLLELAGRLRAAQQEHAEHGELGNGELQGFVDDVLVLDDALARRAHPARQTLLPQCVERVFDRVLVVADDRIAVRASGCTR